ncbi:glutamate racemase [Hydromonas duriensis]|uniref:Glutamate racemase n=1 Tax=Hydromonas duriensis TaxID=1527608 RepID=A0A4R6YBM7_9BURK|nr:glutamate racemase [Hydromonas duriensis]TDR33066.1 glutamate racemase [Hydromonas duriensis]
MTQTQADIRATPILRAAQGPILTSVARAPIGVFDSGVGGLSVWKHLRATLPHEDFIYVADNINSPYGDKSESWIQARMVQMFDWFVAQGCKAIVIACNTATAAAATHLRGMYPDVFIVGLEPAIKPALALTKHKTIAVLATAGTVSSAKYAALLQRTVLPELNVNVLSIPCVGLAERIDAGEADNPDTLGLIANYLEAVKKANVDVVVLGCTHYPFVVQHFRALLNEHVKIIDSGAPVARYTKDVLSAREGLNPKNEKGSSQWYASYITPDTNARWAMLTGEQDVHVQKITL